MVLRKLKCTKIPSLVSITAPFLLSQKQDTVVTIMDTVIAPSGINSAPSLGPPTLAGQYWPVGAVEMGP